MDISLNWNKAVLPEVFLLFLPAAACGAARARVWHESAQLYTIMAIAFTCD
jgi:hypothetical protein